MLIDAPSTLLNTIMHNKHLSHLMAKSMNELARKSPLIIYHSIYIPAFIASYCNSTVNRSYYLMSVVIFLTIRNRAVVIKR